MLMVVMDGRAKVQRNHFKEFSKAPHLTSYCPPPAAKERFVNAIFQWVTINNTKSLL